MAISSRIDELMYSITLILLNTQLNIINSKYAFDSAYEEIPLFLTSQEHILVACSEYDNAKIKRFIKIHDLDSSFTQISESSFLNGNDVVASTFIIDLNNGISFGGSNIITDSSMFWVGHYDDRNILKDRKSVV